MGVTDRAIVESELREMLCGDGSASAQLVGNLLRHLIARFGDAVTVAGTAEALDDLAKVASTMRDTLVARRKAGG